MTVITKTLEVNPSEPKTLFPIYNRRNVETVKKLMWTLLLHDIAIHPFRVRMITQTLPPERKIITLHTRGYISWLSMQSFPLRCNSRFRCSGAVARV